MPFSADQGVVLTKIEGTYGTDPTPTAAANAIEVFDINVILDGRILEREILRAELGRAAHIVGRKLVTVEFSHEFKGSGTLDTPPRWAPLLRAATFQETINAAVDVQYAPRNSGFESVTNYVYLGDSASGILIEQNGVYCRGVLTLPAGGFPSIRWTCIGTYVEPVDAAVPAGTFDSTLPVQVESLGLTIDSVSTFVINQLQLDLGINIQERPDVNSAEGLAGLAISGRRRIGGSIDPELITVATYNFFNKWDNATEVVLTGKLGSAAGNQLQLDASKVQYGAPAPAVRNDFRSLNVPIFINAGGTNELLITHT